MISADSALKTSRENPHDRWNGGTDDAAARIAARVVVPSARQTFKAEPHHTFFAIGSCFARNVEERLEQAGATVTSRNIQMRNLGSTSAREGGVFNKYTPVSILQELKWAAGVEEYPREALLPVTKDIHYDPYLSGKAGNSTVEELLARREEIKRYFQQAFEADVVILTLGLVENWIDKDTGLSLNEAPAPKVLARNKERFAFETLSLEQCEQALAEIADILHAHGKAGQKVILTVSPVPLGRTFSDEDIIVANSTSKTTLRVAAKRFVEQHDGIDYFPSYEAVTLSDPALCWQADRRHVSDVIVGYVIQTFLERYGVSQASEPDLESALAALETDESFQRWQADNDSQNDLLARLNQEVNKYKNMSIRLQSELRAARAALETDTDEDGDVDVKRMVESPSFKKWQATAPDDHALMARMFREINKYKGMVLKMQDQNQKNKRVEGED